MNKLDIKLLANNLNTSMLKGCDSTFANIILYQEKYNTSLEIIDNVLFRYIKNADNSTSLAFPIPLKSASADYLIGALNYIIKNFPQPKFHLITEEQKQLIDKTLKENFQEYSISWETDPADTDYIYLQKNMVELSGKILQKKKNHINRFKSQYENRWTFKSFPENQIREDILEVAEKWFEEKDGSQNADLCAELKIIKDALNNSELLNISGGVLYIDEKPVAMTIASPITQDILDIQFEKATGESVSFGAYAVINNQFARTCQGYTYLNREEDLGIEGLRKAKMSYKPEILLLKFHGELKHQRK